MKNLLPVAACLLLIVLAGGLSGCGQKGGLTRPEPAAVPGPSA